MKVQCDDTVVATEKRFLSVVLLIVKLVTAIQRTLEQLSLLEGGQYFLM